MDATIPPAASQSSAVPRSPGASADPERHWLEQTQLATFNILEDLQEERLRMEQTQRATFNILADIDSERIRNETTQFATFNILEDLQEERQHLEEMQRATFNILDDLREEKAKVERAEGISELRAEELSRTNADLERFAHVVSHDLQEPLRTITGYLQLLETAPPSTTQAERTRFLQNALEGSFRLKRMVADILAFSRTGSSELRKEEVDLDSVLEVTRSNLQTLLAESGGSIQGDHLPTVTGDRGLLGQVFQNLISNALKFHGTSTPVVRVSSLLTGEGWTISIEDNGIGIEARDLHRLFVPFQRLHSAAEFPGSGIGLATCRRIVARHGGRIWIESVVGTGTTVRFVLPTSELGKA